MTRRRIIWYVIVGLLLTAFIYVMKPEISRPTYGLVVREGRAIQAALENYKMDHGVYPAALNDMVPDYIERIGRPTVHGRQFKLRLLNRQRWAYEAGPDRTTYDLSVDGSKFGYIPETDEWSFRWDDGDVVTSFTATGLGDDVQIKTEIYTAN